MLKIRAMYDRIALAKLEPREQDVVDVVSILKAFDIEDFDRVGSEVIRSTIPYFPLAVNYLIDNGISRGTKLEVKDRDLTKEDNEYTKRIAKRIQEYIELQEGL